MFQLMCIPDHPYLGVMWGYRNLMSSNLANTPPPWGSIDLYMRRKYDHIPVQSSPVNLA